MQRLADGEARLLSGARLSIQRLERRTDTAALSLARYPREYRELPLRLAAAARKLSTAAASWGRWKGRELEPYAGGLRAAVLAALAREDGRVRVASSRLEALSPLAVLARGYAITTRAGETKPLTDGSEVEVGGMVDVRLHRGGLRCEVKDIRGQESEKAG